MKKQILSLLIAFGVSVSVCAQIIPTMVHQGSSPRIAMNVNNEKVAELRPAVVYESGNDVEVVIYNKYFSVEQKFTIKNVLKHQTRENEDYVATMLIDSFDTEEIAISRNFFVKNDKWCVVICNRKKKDDGCYDYKLSLVDMEGNLVANVPSELYDSWGNLGNVFLIDFYQGTPFMICEDEKASSVKRMYTFTGKSGIEVAEVSSFKSAYPNPLPAGEVFNVSLPQPADDATFFCVTDMKGRQVCRRKVAPGETTYSLTGSRFSRGHYVYTVIYGDGTTASGRLMAE